MACDAQKSDLEEAHCREMKDLRARHLTETSVIEQQYMDEFDELSKHHSVSLSFCCYY